MEPLQGLSKNALFQWSHRCRRTHRPQIRAILPGPTVHGLYTVALCTPLPHWHRKITVFRDALQKSDQLAAGVQFIVGQDQK